jgi:hypothetical protein
MKNWDSRWYDRPDANMAYGTASYRRNFPHFGVSWAAEKPVFSML